MKPELGPKHTLKIGNNYVLWFESTNSYIVVSLISYTFLQTYLKSKNYKDFVNSLKDDHEFNSSDLKAYFEQLTVFLKDVNSPKASDFEIIKPDTIPDAFISEYYGFGDASVKVNYSNKRLLHLIHPHFEHSRVLEGKWETTFDIFEVNKFLYLYRNKSFIGAYQPESPHLLQGKFAMELAKTIYQTDDADWLATFHASTVCNGSEAIMIIGDSGNGKSTLSALLMANGLDLLSDDFTPMSAKNQQLYRFPAAVSIKKGAFGVIEPLFPEFDSLPSQTSSSKNVIVKYLPPNSKFNSSKHSFECNKIVLVKYNAEASTELRKCEAEKLLQTLIPDAWISPTPEHSKQFLEWLKDLTFYELTYSNNESAVEKFMHLFNS